MKFIGISSGGQLVAFGGGFGIWLPWVLNPEIPVAASQWYLDKNICVASTCGPRY